MIYYLLEGIALTVIFVWGNLSMLCYLVKRTTGSLDHNWMRWPIVIWNEFKPIYLPAATFDTIYRIMHHKVHGAWDIFLISTMIVAYWIFKNDGQDDDRWKKRRKKLAEKIQRVGAKLIVIPARG